MKFRLKLLKLIARATRNVEETREAIETITLQRVSKLHVVMRDGYTLHWEVHNVQDGENPWRDFQRWFHGRENSVTYRLLHNKGEDAFYRADIKRYRIESALEIAK